MGSQRYGFLGLGNMGGPMAANIAAAGIGLVVHDKAGTEARAPAGAAVAAGAAEVAAAAATVFLSLPDGAASVAVARSIAASAESEPGRAASLVIDLSTIGIDAAKEAHAILSKAGVAYVDAPVSGGQAGARAGTITIMWAGPEGILEDHRAPLDAMAGNVFRVGGEPGQGQTMKLLNNFLSATAMVATTEAVTFGQSQGLELATMLDVINASTGRNSASADKFPKRILGGTFDSGFAMALMTKDVGLYRDNARGAGTPSPIGAGLADLWAAAAAALPGADFTRIYDFIRGGAKE